MITINDVEILTIGDGVRWSGSRDTVARDLSFNLLYVPQDDNYPVYKVKCGDKVRWIENDKTLFYGFVNRINYTTDDTKIDVSCQDLTSRLLNSKTLGRYKGTLTEIANNICGVFGFTNGIETDNTIIHNIVSEGDLSYYDVLKIACQSVYERYTLYLDVLTLKIVPTDDIVATFEIGKNIRSSEFSQDISNLINSVIIIGENGANMGQVQDTDSINTYGLFQTTYNFSKDCKNNNSEATKLLKSTENKATLVLDNDNNCISGRYIKVIEPINNFKGIFEIQTDEHTIGADSQMIVDIEFIRDDDSDE